MQNMATPLTSGAREAPADAASFGGRKASGLVGREGTNDNDAMAERRPRWLLVTVVKGPGFRHAVWPLFASSFLLSGRASIIGSPNDDE